MRCLILLWRHLVSINRSIILLITLFFLNILLTLIQRHSLQDACKKTYSQDSSKTGHLLESNAIKGTKHFPSAKQEFNWRKESRYLMDAIPAIKWNDSVKQNESETPFFAKSKHLHKEIEDRDIKSILNETYSQIMTRRTPDDIANVFYIEDILNCGDLEYLEGRDMNPKLTYFDTQDTVKRGELRLPDGETINVSWTLIRNKKNNHLSHTNDREDMEFMKFRKNFYKLLKMQRWPGIPRIYAACLTDEDGQDVIVSKKAHDIHSVRYVVERHDDGVPLCSSPNATEDCLNLRNIRRLVKASKHTGIAALQIISKMSEVFENLWVNGIFPFAFPLNQLVITKSLDVVFADIDSFMYLDPTAKEYVFNRRPLSGLNCKLWQDCAPIPYKDQQLFYQLGLHCKEVKGYCALEGKCWGVDTSTYLCLFAKWIFRQMSQFIPITWKHYKELDSLLDYAAKSIPTERLDWTTFYHAVDNLQDVAVDEWGG